ncbi:hypothetical protein F5B19DRAFT_305703 [Rostrohypoxylon terebratum]|nr:hypothetical protein F5B19DRAFT_305703 [Rostrohypoxylon terebratum]
MAGVWDIVAILNRFELNESKLEHIARVLSRGIMIGAAIFLPAVVRYENIIFRLLVFCLFTIATSAHIAFNWAAVKRYYFFALVIVILPVSVMLPYSQTSIYLLLDRVPILIAVTGLCIEEFSRLLRLLMADSRFEPPDVNPEPNEDLNIHILDRNDDLFVHMDGGENAEYNTPSHSSSDISLSNVGSGRLPSSCDTMTRMFWSDHLDANHEHEEDNGHGSEG